MSQTLTDKLNTIQSIKANIKQAIESKGVTVDGAFDTYPECINSIETGGGDELFATLIDRSISGDVIIPDGVTKIGPNAFQYCSNITSVTIPDGVTSVDGSAFYGCSGITSIELPDTISVIGSDAFRNCSNLRSVKLPSGITLLNSNTFSNCSALTSIELPAEVFGLYAFVFDGCTSLSSVTIRRTKDVVQYGQYAFRNIAKDAILYVPENLLADYQANASWSGAFAEIRAIGGEPAAYTITDLSTDQGNVDYKEWSMLYGETGELPVTFFGTGLSNELDWTNIVNVEYDTGYFSNINFIGVNDVAEDGTWAIINYGYTVVNTESGRLTSSPSEIHFTCGEYSGTINACIFKVKSYEWDSSTDTVNKYPNTINATAIVNLGHCSITDNYLNDDAKTRLTSIIQSPVEWDVTSIDGDVHMIDEFEGEYHVTLHCTLTPEDANSLTVSLRWEGMDAVEQTFAQAVHISQFTLKDAVAINGDDKVHLTKNENNAVVIPQVGPTILLPLSELNDGVNVIDTVGYSISYDNTGSEVVLLNEGRSLQSWDIDGTEYWCIYIDTNKFDREQLLTAKEDNGGTIPQLRIHAEINGVSQDLNVTLGATDMALPTGCTQITDGISNKLSDTEIDTYRYINTNIVPTVNTIVKADLGLRSTHGQCLVGNQGIDDYNDWRLFSTGNIESTDPWNIYFDYGGYYDESNLMDVGNRIEAHVEVSNIVDENNNPKRLSFTISNGKLEVLDSNSEQLVNMTGATWNGHNADNMQPIHIWDDRHSGGWDIDVATMYDVKIYDSQAGVDTSAPLMHVIPVTVNGETKVFDMVTRQYLYVQNFELI